MEFEEIMESINLGLTGDNETDIQYLYAMAQEYKDHELAKEITRACGRMIYDLLSEDQKNEFENELDHDLQGVRDSLDELLSLMKKNDIEKAVELASSLVKTADEIHLFKDDTKSIYFNFLEPFGETLFSRYNRDGKDIRHADFPFTSIYFLHGCLMNGIEQYDEAAESLQKAMKWDPANCTIAFEYAEDLKVSGNLEGFAEVTRNYYKYAYTPGYLARFYRNLGFYYTEKEKYDAATVCYQLSRDYEDTDEAKEELEYIREQTGKDIKPLTQEEIEKIAERADFPIGPCRKVLSTAAGYGIACLKSDNPEGALYYYSIFADLNRDGETARMVEQLKNIVEASQEERKGG